MLRHSCTGDETVLPFLDRPAPPTMYADTCGTADDGDMAAFAAIESAAERDPKPSSLLRLGRGFGLGPFDMSVFLVALAPDLDSRYGQFYACLNNDVALPRATVALALALSGISPLSTTARSVFSPTGPLRSGGLLAMEGSGLPFLTRALCVPDRVTDHLLGHDALPPQVHPVLRPARTLPLLPGPLGATAARVAAVLSAPARRPVHLRHRPGSAGGSAGLIAAAASHRLGRPLLTLDWERLGALPDTEGVLAAVVLEARLRQAVLLVEPARSATAGQEDVCARALLSRLTEAAGVVPLVLAGGADSGDCASTGVSPMFLECPGTTAADRAALWRAELTGLPDPDLMADVVAPYRVDPHRIADVVATARRQAQVMDRALAPGDLTAAARLHHGTVLGRLARRVDPGADWADLVVPDATVGRLRALAGRVRHRDRVLGEWGLRPGGARGHGVSALLTGPSGTGKTLAAEVIAADLGFDLHVVDLSTVMSKYIGETEKHLENLFTEAEGLNGILLFDEADALFSKRTAVRDAHDRHANATTAYLLQRLEAFDGITLLTSNLHSNIDNAYLRRFDFVIPFTLPDEEGRRALWDNCLGPSVPRSGSLDLALLARRFELTGGEIRCCAITAAYRAAHDGRAISTADLLEAVRIEYHKLSRYIDEDKFSLRADH
ncbi:ATP-binding protein [Streptomyces sp. NPDC048161]|uniref:ATP-binding protein n=1 Tax=Streptomyces sp. NPDC048161 TaxID=3160985 RepID=UPI0033EC29BD